MPLDMFQRDRDEAAGYALANSAPDLPVEAGEAFSTAFLRSALFGQSTAALNARTAVAAEYAGELEAQTGDQSLRASLSSGGIDRLNARIRQIAGERPDLGLRELDDDELTKRQATKSRLAVADYRAMADREKTLGGTIGFFAGGAVGDITDPVNLTTFPLAAPASLGIIGTAAAWSAIGGGTQLAIEALGAPYRERIQPGYVASGEPLANIAGTAAFAGVLGGGIKGAAAAWTRLRTGEWPRSVRDAGNVVDSEANIQGSNALPGVEGEVAHREALGKAIDDIAAGKPVDVSEIVTPEVWQASQDVIARMQAQHFMALPIVDENALRLAVEQDGLRNRLNALDRQLESLPSGRAEGAQRLARVQAIEEQIANATTAAERRTLSERRDELLADTTPESLGAEAAAIERKRQVTAEREAIVSRLAEIKRQNAERAFTAEPAINLGQMEPARYLSGVHERNVIALAEEPSPGAISPANADDVLLRNLDRLRAERPDVKIPVGEAIDADGRATPVMRSVDDAMAEADARLTAAREIMDCVGGYPEAAQ